MCIYGFTGTGNGEWGGDGGLRVIPALQATGYRIRATGYRLQATGYGLFVEWGEVEMESWAGLPKMFKRMGKLYR